MSTASWPARVQLGDAAVAVRVVVHGVDHDLARESRRGQPVVGLQRHGRHHQVTGAGGLLGGGRPRVPAEFGDEAGECLRSARVAEYDVQSGRHGEAGQHAADHAAADESKGLRHGGFSR
jgi:hypothetical protein